MSVASEINRIKANIADAYNEAEAKGATMPATENSANLADTVASIPSGGGGGDSRYTEFIQRTITTVSDANVTSIGFYAFYGCSSLTSVNFPNATEILDGAFAYCIGLTSVEFPNVTSIGPAAFFLSANLSTIILHKRATIAEARAINLKAIVYVENADLDWYSTATNWSAIYADGRIKSIDELPE